jgi:hypothetical protein
MGCRGHRCTEPKGFLSHLSHPFVNDHAMQQPAKCWPLAAPEHHAKPRTLTWMPASLHSWRRAWTEMPSSAAASCTQMHNEQLWHASIPMQHCGRASVADAVALQLHIEGLLTGCRMVLESWFSRLGRLVLGTPCNTEVGVPATAPVTAPDPPEDSMLTEDLHIQERGKSVLALKG